MNGVGATGAGPDGDTPPRTPRVPGLVMLRRLGIGGHGEVWLAADLASGERVAVKVRRDGVPATPSGSGGPGSAGGPGGPGGAGGLDGVGGPSGHGGDGGLGGVGGLGSGGERLAREIALLRRIEHPHVVRLRRVVDLPDGGRALVMDHAAGGNLADLVAGRGPLDPAEVCTVVVPLARTLAELHGRGLVHGDLSPANVLFTANGRPMIADLGCAVVLGEHPTDLWGSDGYADPGRTGPPQPVDDVFALGALVRFALTGSPLAGSVPPVTGTAADALLALADLCGSPAAPRRPGPEDVARAALAAVAPAPVRLLQPTAGGAPSPMSPAAGPPAPGVPAAGAPATGGPAAGRRGAAGSWAAHQATRQQPAGRSGTGGPSDPPAGAVSDGRAPGEGTCWPSPVDGSRRVRPVARVRPPAARQGWTRPPDPEATPTAATVLPMTTVDLDLDLGAGRVGGGSGGPRAAGTVTRRRSASPTAPPTEPPGAQRRVRRSPEPPRRGSLRPPQHERSGRGRSGRREPALRGTRYRFVLIGAALVAGVGAWWLPVLGGAHGEAGTGPTVAPALSGSPALATVPAPTTAPAPTASPPLTTSPSTAAPGSSPVAGEPVEVAVVLLAQRRAAALGAGTVIPLAAVNEPGSPAMSADVELVRRLGAQGLRLEGLSFRVTAVHRLPGQRAGSVSVEATVITSAHRQVSLRDGAVRATVPASAPRRVTLTLVPAPGGPGWLVRSVGPGATA